MGVDVTVRGGNVGIVENTNGECRFRADYRGRRLAPEGRVTAGSMGTDRGVGFRCARDLTTEEWTTFAADPRFGHLVEGAAPETLAIEQPSYTIHVEPPEVSADADATGSDAEANGSDDAGPME